PNAMATAFALPDRVGTVGIAAAVGPVFDNPQFDAAIPANHAALLPIAREDRDAAIALVRQFAQPSADAWAADPHAYFATFVADWPEPDQASFRAERDEWMLNLGATYGRGVDTFVDEVASTFGPWGFDLGDVRVPVRAWHGLADDLPIAPIEYVI